MGAQRAVAQELHRAELEVTHGVVGPIAQIQEPLQLVRAAEADLLVDTDGQPPLLVELPIRLQNILEVVVGDEVEVVRVDLHDPLGGSLQTGGFQNVLDLLHRIALPAALDAHGGIFTDVAVGQTVGAEVHGLLGGGLPLVPQAGQLQRHRVHAHDMARCKKIGTSEAMASRSLRSGILLVSVQLIWLKLQPMTQRLVPRTFSAPSLHIRTTSS